MTRNCVFEGMWLVSHVEKRGLRITFDRNATVIRGENDTGKSAVIKSLFGSMGASMPSVHSRWKTARVRTLLRFAVGQRSYFMWSNSGLFGLFNADGQHIATYRSVSEELAPALADLFEFRLMLQTQDGRRATPTPAFQYLPFYIDQDTGWAKPLSSFDRLQQFVEWRRELVDYHLGISTREHVQNAVDEAVILDEIASIDAEMAGLAHARKTLEGDLPPMAFDASITGYQEAVDELLGYCEELRRREEQYRLRLQSLELERIRLEAQREIVATVRGDLEDDYGHAVRELPDESVECPLCGAVYENSFAERFAIAEDENRCNDLLADIDERLAQVAKKIESQRRSLDEADGESKRVQELLGRKHGQVTLQLLIQTEGRREMGSRISAEEARLKAARATQGARQVQSHARHVELLRQAREVRRSVLDEHERRMTRYVEQLRLNSWPREQWSKLEGLMRESGSDQPRAILAYTFSILHGIAQHGQSTFFPIVIDSPRQQDIDAVNYRAMLEFVRSERPAGGQLILGLVDDLGMDFGGSTIGLTQPDYALRCEEYAGVAEYMQPFEKATLA